MVRGGRARRKKKGGATGKGKNCLGWARSGFQLIGSKEDRPVEGYHGLFSNKKKDTGWPEAS